MEQMGRNQRRGIGFIQFARWRYVIIPAKARENVFTGVGLCVCLSVTTITKQNKLWTDLHQILRKYSYGKGKIKFVFRYDW